MLALRKQLRDSHGKKKEMTEKPEPHPVGTVVEYHGDTYVITAREHLDGLWSQGELAVSGVTDLLRA